ncbi:alpha/beta fold hydrolase [Actinomycetospora chibensis]|uniref:Alpha/beta fold hydrolase n=1 Tax=Actinomycetospora chibensis TaxID=663606 RepID=A0ABV9RIB5_9PSEU|nr:alpha/beta fold hydrolase [Actinomycetospora chibensis]MDD7925081.1 alpha/beta fold hydrolase [Actinomycetospora chibensis]
MAGHVVVGEDVEPSYRGGSGPPLVLLHGASMSWRAWRPVLDELERHHEVFAPTMTGHRGGVPWVDGTPVRVEAIVDAVGAQLDEAGIATAHVAGNSLGGWVALELARRGRAETCTAFSPAGAWRRPFDLRRLIWTFRLGLVLGRPRGLRRLAAHPGARRVLLNRVMEHGERVPEQDVEGFFEDLAGCVVIDELLSGARAGDGLPAFPELPCPVRVAWSERDHILPWRDYGVPMQVALPGADFVRLPRCGHVPMWDDPELVVRSLLQVTQARVTSPETVEV